MNEINQVPDQPLQYYNANGLLSGMRYRPTAGHPGYFPTGRLNFTRDGSGLITNTSEDLAMTVSYDPELQISSIAHTLPQPFDESYTYDDNGNRLTSLSNTFIYDDLNKLTESSTHEYQYDADGNMISERNKITGETKKYYWDSENRLIKYEHLASDISPVDTTALYTYDIYGRRIRKDVNGSVTKFMWEGDNISLELDSSNAPIRKYFTEMEMDTHFAHVNYAEVTNWSEVLQSNYPQGWHAYIKDQVGTVYKVWDHNAKAIADDRAYDSFGNLVSQSGTTKTPMGFQGKYYDQESGLNYFYHRYYNAVLGRFIGEDPIGLDGGLNLFNFVGSNPVRFTDKYGFERDWSSEMPNGGGWSNMKGGEFTALFGGSPMEILGWTIEGTLNDLKEFDWCCFSTCMLKKNAPTFSKKIATNIMTWTVLINPDILPILKSQFLWMVKKIGIVFYGTVAKSVWDCYLECR